MNELAFIILLALLSGNAVRMFAMVANLGALSLPAPREFADVYDAGRYSRMREYIRARTRFGLVHMVFDLSLLLLFWFAGGFGVLDEWLRTYSLSPLITGLLYLGALAIGRSLLSLPFSIYSTFVIEQRFGFNRTSWKTFMSDLVKGALLTLLLGAPLLVLLLWLFSTEGPFAWLYLWGATTSFLLAVHYVAPAWILPLFNRFTTLGEGQLREEIIRYAGAIRFPVKDIYIMDGSRRSSRANAFFTGFGKNRRAVLYDTLTTEQSASEVTAVLAHEIGHYRLRHIPVHVALGIAQQGLMLFLLSLFMDTPALTQAFYIENHSIHTALVSFALLYGSIELPLSLLVRALRRKHEYEADEYATRTYGDGDALISALKKLSANNLSNLTPHPLYVLVYSAHPPLLRRIEAIREAMSRKTPRRRPLRLRWSDFLGGWGR
jgi:STE24 endopeptidase